MAKRVFFSFHYQDVIDFRANAVRNHNVTKNDNGGFFDASIWETARQQGEAALKRLINNGLENTSVTAVLIGRQTYARRWVRYEIMKSVSRGNDVLGIHINGIRDKHEKTYAPGPNPFDHLGLTISDDGCTGTPIVWNGQGWEAYADMGSFGIARQPVADRGNSYQLSRWFGTYDWVADNGFENFGRWIA